MFKQMRTRNWHWNVSALLAVLFLGAAALSYAQEYPPAKRDIDEIQAEINRLQGELRNLRGKMQEAPKKTEGIFTKDMVKALPGKYFGMEGNDLFGIVIEEPKDGVYPITFYEDGLPGHGFNPKDDDKYIGTAIPAFDEENKTASLNIALKQKFDGQREEPVEQAVRGLTAAVETPADRNGIVDVRITLPRNREWGAVQVTKEKRTPEPASAQRSDAPVNASSLAGRYLGWEGDDRMGMVLTLSNEGEGHYNVSFYEDGLPGAGFNRRDDDRYEGTATLDNNTYSLEIRLTKKFDEERPERVERSLQNLTATISTDNGKNVKINIPRNSEWDGVSLKKL